MFLMAGTSAGTYPTLWLPQNASVEGLHTSTLCHKGNPAVNPTCVAHSHVSCEQIVTCTVGCESTVDSWHYWSGAVDVNPLYVVSHFCDGVTLQVTVMRSLLGFTQTIASPQEDYTISNCMACTH